MTNPSDKTVSELKPCAFCGGTDIFIEPDELGSGGQWVSPIHVGCTECKAEQYADTEDEAVAKWNRRAALSSQPVPASVREGLAQTVREVLDHCLRQHPHVNGTRERLYEAVRALEILSQQAAAEPVAEIVLFGTDLKEVSWRKGKMPPPGTKLYDAPVPQAAAQAPVQQETEKRAPVQGYVAGIPWSMHLEAYDAYCKRYGRQQALIEGGCRGGFGTGELDMFIPGWREKVSEIAKLKARIATLEKQNAAPVQAVQQPTKGSEWNAAIEAAAKAAENHSLAEQLARLTMANPVTHSLNLCRAVANSIRSLLSTAPAQEHQDEQTERSNRR
jgi:Restriction alleviation protein Lar